MDLEATGLTVLLVEDNPGDVRLIRELAAEASQAPARLTHVDRPAAALERVRQPGVDVVLLDLGLPDSQGLATFTRLRDAAPQLPIVVLSGQTDATLALGAAREGAQEYVHVSGGPLVGHWDPQRMGRVLDNLVGNAIKYSRRLGPISVELAREADAHGEWAVIKVRDHGVGIPAAEQERIFEQFYRGSNVASDVRGVGIGLSGVRQIVEQHGGSIGVESQEPVGSTLTVRLPLG